MSNSFSQLSNVLLGGRMWERMSTLGGDDEMFNDCKGRWLEYCSKVLVSDAYPV